MINRPLTLHDLQADYRRVTLLTTLTLSSVYVVSDFGLRLGNAYNIALAQQINSYLPTQVGGQILVFGTGLLLIWLLFYVFDSGFAQAGEQSWAYRIGAVAHLRPFNTVCTLALLLAALAAFHYQITDVSFWLLWTLLLITCMLNFIEHGAAIRQRLGLAGLRLRLLFVRIPFFGRRLVRSDRLNRELAASLEQPDAAPAAADQPADPTAPPPVPDTTAAPEHAPPTHPSAPPATIATAPPNNTPPPQP